MTPERFTEIVNQGRADYQRNSGWAPTCLYLGPSAYDAFRELCRRHCHVLDPACTEEFYMEMLIRHINEDEIRIGTTCRIYTP